MNASELKTLLRRRRSQRLIAVALALLAAWPWPALACAVCFGDPESPLSKGLTMGVLFLIGVVLVVLGGVAAFFVYLGWRARTGATRQPEELGIATLSKEDLAAYGK